uniref:Pheromone n=1 Tax=Agrocybe salicacicola TaxID=1078488 RepID=A0A2P0M861_9AGAR|nr:pheromone precursor [Agrocybe salicacicola]
MDAFTDFEFDLSQFDISQFEGSLIRSSDSSKYEDNTMKQLVDADTRLAYGGYCVIA